MSRKRTSASNQRLSGVACAIAGMAPLGRERPVGDGAELRIGQERRPSLSSDPLHDPGFDLDARRTLVTPDALPQRPRAGRGRQDGAPSRRQPLRFRAAGPTLAFSLTNGPAKQPLQPGIGVPAVAPAEAVKTARPPLNGGPFVSAATFTAIVLSLLSHGNRRVDPKAEPEPRAIERPDACSTLTLTDSPNTVSDGSSGEQDTVTGSLIATRPMRVGLPRLIDIASAFAAVRPHVATANAVGKSLRNIGHFLDPRNCPAGAPRVTKRRNRRIAP